ncbi:DUF4436 domain-containing protein [Mycobacterium sp. SMC-4]|uniref:DUF4436 domain-containing protein n=1 Tax=Mycobacterium sp. SMC-4 TaxID=2857059 RepID=UPI0021B1E432|nr:DUF4436 domain-containing protein [Mycobacterium sp. SMC-4]UXA20175.1 DUF4436 domain-containing protein [Mycobacterium sp. SMC-4]
MQSDAGPKAAEKPGSTQRHKRAVRATVLTTVLAVLGVYVASIVGYALLEPPPAPFEFSEASVDAQTSVIIRLHQLETADNRLTVDVLLHPGDDLIAEGPEVLENPIVRLSSWTQSRELIYIRDELKSNASKVELTAVGDPDNWPLDTYTTNILGVEAFLGDGAERRALEARIIVAGSVNGWTVQTDSGTIDAPWGPIPSVQFTLQRTRGAHAIDVGILLVLLTLPATALFVSIEMLLRRRKFLPPFITWFAAMLFAVVPLRNVLPGSPPPGSWVDLAVVLWVLLALAGAMVIFIIAWWQQTKGELESASPAVR